MIRVNIDGKYKTIKINYVSNEERLEIVKLFSSDLGGKPVDYDKVNNIQIERNREITSLVADYIMSEAMEWDMRDRLYLHINSIVEHLCSQNVIIKTNQALGITGRESDYLKEYLAWDYFFEDLCILVQELDSFSKLIIDDLTAKLLLEEYFYNRHMK